MRARKLVVSLALATVVFAGLAGAAAAHEGHGSCAGFGALGKPLAQQYGGLGPLVAPVAMSGPGALAGTVAAEHDIYCD